MDYEKHYTVLIERAKNRILDTNVYFEKHHITPKCLGGTNAQDNIVRLFPEEHYIAHQLLVKMNPTNLKLIYALNIMSTSTKYVSRQNNKRYGWARKKFVELQRGKKHSEETKRKIGLKSLGRTWSEKSRHQMSEYSKNRPTEHNIKNRLANSGENNPNFGKRGILNCWYGRTHSLDTKQKMTNSALNRKWMYNEYLNIQKSIKEEFILDYIKTGWKFGMLQRIRRQKYA